MAPGEVRDLDLRVRARSCLGPVAAAASDPDGQQPWFSTTIGLACATHMCQTPDLSVRPTGSASGGPRLWTLSISLSLYLSTYLPLYLSIYLPHVGQARFGNRRVVHCVVGYACSPTMQYAETP